jgi:hypothetical protein
MALRELQPKIYHVKRNLNGVAHDCAKQAIRQSQSMSIYSCTNSSHALGRCPVALAIQNLMLQGTVLHAVNCL